MISISKLCSDAGCFISFKNSECFIQEPSKIKLTLLGKLEKGLYSLSEELLVYGNKFSENNYALSSLSPNAVKESKLWHLRLGNLSFGKIKNIKSVDVKGCLDECFCQIFPLAK